MPLVPGDSRESVGKNISILRSEGKAPKQAIAIALNMAGKSKTASVADLAGEIAADPVKLAMWETLKASLRGPEQGTKTAQEELEKLSFSLPNPFASKPPAPPPEDPHARRMRILQTLGPMDDWGAMSDAEMDAWQPSPMTPEAAAAYIAKYPDAPHMPAEGMPYTRRHSTELKTAQEELEKLAAPYDRAAGMRGALQGASIGGVWGAGVGASNAHHRGEDVSQGALETGLILAALGGLLGSTRGLPDNGYYIDKAHRLPSPGPSAADELFRGTKTAQEELEKLANWINSAASGVDAALQPALLGAVLGAGAGALGAGEGHRGEGAVAGGLAGGLMGGAGGMWETHAYPGLANIGGTMPAVLPGTAAAGALAGMGQRRDPSQEKTASPWGSILKGTAMGGAAGAGIGALGAHMRGGDVGEAALKGGLGGAAGGAALGGLHSMFKNPPAGTAGWAQDKLAPSLIEKGLGAGLIGAGTLAGGAVTSAAFGDGIAEEMRAKEIGKFNAQQELLAQQRQTLAPKHQEAFQRAMADDTVQRAPQDIIHSAFETMRTFAPNLAADPNATLSFLRESAIYGTGPSYASIKSLADSEKSVVSAAKLAGANR